MWWQIFYYRMNGTVEVLLTQINKDPVSTSVNLRWLPKMALIAVREMGVNTSRELQKQHCCCPLDNKKHNPMIRGHTMTNNNFIYHSTHTGPVHCNSLLFKLSWVKKSMKCKWIQIKTKPCLPIPQRPKQWSAGGLQSNSEKSSPSAAGPHSLHCVSQKNWTSCCRNRWEREEKHITGRELKLHWTWGSDLCTPVKHELIFYHMTLISKKIYIYF